MLPPPQEGQDHRPHPVVEQSAPDPESITPSPDTSPLAGLDWYGLVDRIQSGEASGMEDLYRIFSRGVRYYLCRRLGPQEIEDRIHDTFLIVVQAIQRGDLREPERLLGFIRTVVRRQVAASIDRAVHSRREETELDFNVRIADIRQNPEEQAMVRERQSLMSRILGGISRRDREILTRFYLNGESQEQICSEMALTETQFRLLKSRAKARFGEMGKRKLARNTLGAYFLRKTASA
ncbi:MAG: sigma-70 family RNA polymerase sigma factor [Bryobacteraceae bacterium]|nr:sigma-70 family RNA polymerase sigma factor [Bryobacteraceae bacterium]